MKTNFSLKRMCSAALFVRLSTVTALAVPLFAVNPALAQNAPAGQPAAIVNRLEQLLGGLDNSQRDVARQIAEAYVRDRAQYPEAATTQFESGLRTKLAPAQFEKYQASRDYVLNGTGPKPAAAQGSRTQGEAASAVVTRLERTVGVLDNSQRDVARQAAESYVRDRGQYGAAATTQFESALRTNLAPAQFEKYQASRDFVLNGGKSR